VSWTQLLANKSAQKHTTSKHELDNMRELIARDLADAAVAGLSADRRFATAYNAALQAANMAIACAGYRITAKIGHHKVSLESAALALGSRQKASRITSRLAGASVTKSITHNRTWLRTPRPKRLAPKQRNSTISLQHGLRRTMPNSSSKPSVKFLLACPITVQ